MTPGGATAAEPEAVVDDDVVDEPVVDEPVAEAGEATTETDEAREVTTEETSVPSR